LRLGYSLSIEQSGPCVTAPAYSRAGSVMRPKPSARVTRWVAGFLRASPAQMAFDIAAIMLPSSPFSEEGPLLLDRRVHFDAFALTQYGEFAHMHLIETFYSTCM
jgi:hypothetical protein